MTDYYTKEQEAVQELPKIGQVFEVCFCHYYKTSWFKTRRLVGGCLDEHVYQYIDNYNTEAYSTYELMDKVRIDHLEYRSIEPVELPEKTSSRHLADIPHVESAKYPNPNWSD